jgi:hypothetical protein
MKLTYRGIIYKLQKTDAEPHQHHYSVASNKYCLNNAQAENKVILIRPIHYFTYRGVSYTKNLVFDIRNKLLLDIDRQ